MYNLVWSSNVWQNYSNGGEEIPSSHRSTVHGRREWDFQSVSFRLGKRSKVGLLSTANGGDFVQVQDQWDVVVPAYDRLRDRYRRSKRRSARQLSYSTVPMNEPGWRPRGGVDLTDMEVKYLSMTPAVTFYTRITVNKVQFRPRGSQQKFRKDDSVIQTWYHDADVGGVETTIYGIINKIFTHSLYPGGPQDVLLECEWLENVPEDDQGGEVGVYLPQVRANPDSPLNQCARYVFLKQCAAYNIMLAPHNPWDDKCDVYDVIDRWRTYEDHSL